jgi:hypothetical protein
LLAREQAILENVTFELILLMLYEPGDFQPMIKRELASRIERN